MGVEPTNAGFADPSPADEDWNLYNVESRGIEPRLSACKAEVLTVITMAPYSILCYLYTLKEYQTFRVIL